MNFAAVDLSILGPALLAGLLVLTTHVPMGRQVLARGIVFIDLAVAQIAGFGVVIADFIGWEGHGLEAQLAAVTAAVLGALLLTWTDKRWPDVQEAIIGVLFVLAATGGILMLSHNPHGGEHLKELLVGQILWVTPEQLLLPALIYAFILALCFTLGGRLGRLGFYLLFALSVTVSVQLVGVYLVFSSLIIPALATSHLSGRRGLWTGYALGAGGYVVGLLFSTLFDLPSGAVIVWALAMLALLTSVLLRRP